MKFICVAFCLLAFSQSALAQQGISNKRDMYGNLARGGGNPSQGGINQAAPNPNGMIRNVPRQPAINAAKATRTTR